MELGKVPPHDEDAEQAVLGSMLTDNDAVMAAVEVLKEDAFYREDNKIIYQAILNLYSKSEPIDIITLKDELESMGKFEQVGGFEYLASLPDKVPTTANVQKYIKIVEEKSVLRNLIKTANEIIELGYNPTEDVEDIMDGAEKKIFDIMQSKNTKSYTPIKDVLVESFTNLEKLYNQIKQTNADIVFANQFCMKDDKCIEKIYDYTDKMFFDRKQAIEDYLMNSVSMAGRIYKSDLFKNIRFPVGVRMGEDAFALIHILMNVEKTCFCPEEVYYRRIRKGSASRSHFSDSDIEMIGVMEEIADYILNNNYNGKILVGKYMVGKYAEVLLKNAVYANKEVYRQLRKKYKQWYLLSDKMKDEPAAVRMRFALLETSPKLYQTIKRLF